MKKQIILAALVVGFAASSFGQGYMLFATSGRSWLYDNFTTPGTSVLGGSAGSTIDLAVLIATQGDTPLVGSVGNPTGNTSTLSPNVWTEILNDPNFSLVGNAIGGTNAIVGVNTANTTRGGFAYNGGSSFQVAGYGSISGNVNVTAYVIGWNSAYATPQAAALANAAVGWSNPFTYIIINGVLTTPATMNASGMTAFGVSPVPEPATMALAGLGGLALLAFRRRK